MLGCFGGGYYCSHDRRHTKHVIYMLRLRRINGTCKQPLFGEGLHPSSHEGSYGATYLKAH